MSKFMMYFFFFNGVVVTLLLLAILHCLRSAVKYRFQVERLKLDLLELKTFQLEYYRNTEYAPACKVIFSKRYLENVEKWIFRMDNYLKEHEDD